MSLGAADPDVGRERSGRSWGYRPHLDGLRAIAVYLVVAYHCGLERVTGGFIGVDVFFVLSGYLVTQVLRRDLQTHERIRLRRFYARRVRRLLPASLVTLAVVAVVFGAIGSPAVVDDLSDAIRACALYVANWFFIARSDAYFGADVATSPVLHFWSLAVEEQFYLVWPLALGGLVAVAGRAGRFRWTVVRGVVAVAAAASLGAALLIARSDLDRAYYGTDTRAYQLLAGALLALSPGVVERLGRAPSSTRLAGIVSGAALLTLPVLALTRVDVGPVTRGVAATAVVVVLLTAAELARGGLVDRALSLPPVVYLGRISYGTYLWHWPVIIALGEVLDLTSRSLLFVTVLLATALASLSHQVLELPIRRWSALDRRTLPVVATGLVASVVVGVLLVPQILEADHAEAVDAAVEDPTTRIGSVDADSVDWRAARDDLVEYWQCGDPSPVTCPIVEGDGDHVLVLGDSHANALVPMLAGVAEARDLRLTAAVLPVCPWQRGLQYLIDERAEACRRAKAEWYDTAIEELDPDIVVVANRPIDDPDNTAGLTDEEGVVLEPGTPAMTATVEAHTRETVEDLVVEGRRVVIMEPIPSSKKDEPDPLSCLAEAEETAQCRFVSGGRPTPIERTYRDLAAGDSMVWAVDLDRQVCPYLPICDPVVGGDVVRFDSIHLTATFARSLAPAFEQLLVDNQVLD